MYSKWKTTQGLQPYWPLDLFYPNEIRKITERQTHFAEERRFWEAQPD